MKITTAKRLARLIAVIGILAVSATNASPVRIRWEIGNRFRNLDFLKHDPGEISVDSRRAADHNNSGLIATKWFEAVTSDSPNQGSKDPRDQIAWMDHIAETVGSPYVEGDNGVWDEASGSYDKPKWTNNKCVWA